MLTSAPLAEWLSDPTRQEATHRRTLDFADRWLRKPLFMDAAREVKSGVNQTIDSLLSVAGRFMDRQDEIQQMLDELITEAKADPFFRPPFAPLPTGISNGYVLFDSEQLSILVNVISADRVAAKNIAHGGNGTVAFTGMVTLYRYLRAGGATLAIWEAPAADEQFQADVHPALTLIERRRIQDGDSWIMDGRRQSFIIEHATTDIVQLQAQVKLDCAHLAVDYDIKTGAFAGASTTDENSSRTQMMVTLLRLMGCEETWPLVEQLVDSPHFFTRWHLMREFLALNADAALPHLRRMAANDPHPEVRAAAGETLKLFFPGEMNGGNEACPA